MPATQVLICRMCQLLPMPLLTSKIEEKTTWALIPVTSPPTQGQVLLDLAQVMLYHIIGAHMEKKWGILVYAFYQLWQSLCDILNCDSWQEADFSQLHIRPADRGLRAHQ